MHAVEQYVTPEDFAEILGISRAHTFNLIRRGAIPSLKLGKSRRIPLGEAVDALRADRTEADIERAVEL